MFWIAADHRLESYGVGIVLWRVGTARFNKKDLASLVLTQAAREDRASGAAADDDDVVRCCLWRVR
ncbi:hypothetical protein D3C71_1303780 [compost metagenome]